MIHLTEEQSQSLRNGHAVRLPLPEIGQDVVLLRGQDFARIQMLLEDDREKAAWAGLAAQGGQPMGTGESVLISPGEMYWADLPTGRRPIVVVSREDLNRGNYVVAVLCTTVNFAVRSTLSNCVPFRAGEFGLPQDCVAQCEAITFVDKQDLDIQAGLIGTLDDARMREIIHALGYVFESDCEPS